MTSSSDDTKPRVRICWHCGRKLRGNYFTEVVRDGHLRILHKECAEHPELVITDAELLADHYEDYNGE